ncbi:hypothetical protein [Actinocrispum sp. NPDC049592]|uniref:hypothetical protein n=1 Tax=Actinocrispum sp. NPDC049592 TaxID=3154835 RepID=UPI0034201F1E
MVRFEDDDRGYLGWLAAHPAEFVLNIERTLSPPTNLVLHSASCYTINGTPARGKQWTGPYIKVCGTRAELEGFVRREAGAQARVCRLCLG